MKEYKAGAMFGAVVGLLAYILTPIYSDIGPASILPTANVVSDAASYNIYIANLPFSVFIWVTLEILGIGAGMIAQMIFRRNYSKAM